MVSALTSPVDHLACPPCLWLDPFKLRRFLSEYCVATTATHPPQGASGAGRVPVRSSPCEYVISRLEQQEQKLAAVEDADKAQQHSTAAKPERGRAQTLVELHGKAKVVWAAGSATAGVVTFLDLRAVCRFMCVCLPVRTAACAPLLMPVLMRLHLLLCWLAAPAWRHCLMQHAYRRGGPCDAFGPSAWGQVLARVCRRRASWRWRRRTRTRTTRRRSGGRYWHQHNADDAEAQGQGGRRQEGSGQGANSCSHAGVLGLGKSLAPVVVDGRFLLPGLPAASVLALAAEDVDEEEDDDDNEDARELIDFNDIAHLLVDREEEGGEEQEEQEEQEGQDEEADA